MLLAVRCPLSAVGCALSAVAVCVVVSVDVCDLNDARRLLFICLCVRLLVSLHSCSLHHLCTLSSFPFPSRSLFFSPARYSHHGTRQLLLFSRLRSLAVLGAAGDDAGLRVCRTTWAPRPHPSQSFMSLVTLSYGAIASYASFVSLPPTPLPFSY